MKNTCLRLLLLLATGYWLLATAHAGQWTANGYFYEPSMGAAGQTEYNQFNQGLANADAELALLAANGGGGGRANLSALAPLNYNCATGAISMPQASAAAAGYLCAADWSTFNAKQAALPVGTVSQYLRGDLTMQPLNAAALGLGNVLNEAQEPAIAPGTTSQYWRGDKSWQTLNAAAVGLTFSQSLLNTSGTVALSGDSTSPGNSMLYGTNASGLKGWYSQTSSMTWPSASGIPVYGGSGAWGSSLTAPGSALVGVSDTQTLTNKTLTSPTLTAPALGTPQSGNLANCTFPTLNQNTTGTAANVTGVVAAANGGTGSTANPNAANGVVILNSSGQLPAVGGANLTNLTAAQVGAAPATSGTGILKGNGSGGTTAAVPGADFAPATSGSAILKGNGAGGFANANPGTDYVTPTGSITGQAGSVAGINGLITAGSNVTFTGSGTVASPYSISASGSGGSMTYPGAGVPASTGSAWGTSYAVGAAANDLVQFNSLGALTFPSANSIFLGGGSSANPGINGQFIGIGQNTLASIGSQPPYYLTAIGWNALNADTSGDENVAVGAVTLRRNTTGSDNTAVGDDALTYNTIGYQNAAFGQGALVQNTTGNLDTACGKGAAGANTTGSNNTAVGYSSLFTNTSGTDNTSVGYSSGAYNITGSYNTYLGDGAGTTSGGTALNYVTAIGYGAQAGASNVMVLGGLAGSANAVNVGIGTSSPTAQLHTTGTVRFSNFGAGLAAFDASGNISSTITPALGTPASGNLANCTFPTLNQNTTGQAGTVATINGLVAAGSNVTITGSGTSGSPYSIAAAAGGGSMAWPASAGIAIYSGSSSWGTSLSAPASALVGISDTQTLTNKTLTAPILTTPALGTPASGNLANCTFPTLNQNTTGSAASCTGDAASATLWGAYASIAGPSSAVTYTLPASSATMLYSGGPLGTPASGNLANCTFPTLNQNTTGQAGSVAGINGLISAGGNVTITGSGTSASPYSIASAAGGSMAWPASAGITVYGGSSSWGTSLSAPASALVGISDSQTLSNKTFGSGMTWPIFNQSTTGAAGSVTGETFPTSGLIVGTTDSQTLTHKTLTDSSNVFPTLNQNTTGTAAGLSGSQTANYFYAAPNGSNGTASFRAIKAADVPTLNQNTTGQAGSVAGINGLISAGSNVTITGSGTSGSPYSIAAAAGGSMTWPASAGITVYGGSSSWGTSLSAPASALVGISDTQTLTNKTLTAPTLTTPALGTPASGNLANCTFPTLNQNTTGSAASCTGDAASATLWGAYASIAGPSSAVTYTLPASSATMLYSGGPLGTPASGNLANCTFPTLNQNTTGQAGSVAGINGLITAGSNVTLSGSGTTASPYSISSSGSGTSFTSASPLVLASGSLSLSGATGGSGAGSGTFYGTNGSGIWGSYAMPSWPLAWTDLALIGGTGGPVLKAAPVPGDGLLLGDSANSEAFSYTTLGDLEAAIWNSPMLVAPALGTPASGNLANCTFPTLNQNTTGQAGTVATINGLVAAGSNVTITGSGTSANPYSIAAAAGGGSMTWPASAGITVYGGSSSWGTSLSAPASALVGISDTQTLTNKTLTAPTLTTPALGTPASGNLANCTFPTLNQNTTGQAGSVAGINGLITAGSNVTLSGSGTTASPYSISSSGSGTSFTSASPLVLASGSLSLSGATGGSGAGSGTFYGTNGSGIWGSYAMPSWPLAWTNLALIGGTGGPVLKAAPVPGDGLLLGDSANSEAFSYTTLGDLEAAIWNSPTLVAPALGTPASGTLTNCTGLPLTTGVTGVLPAANGGSGYVLTGGTTTSSTPTPALGTTGANYQYELSALAGSVTFGAPTGTFNDGQKLMIRVYDNGTAQTLAWNAAYVAGITATLPTTTRVGKYLYVGFIYNSAASEWDCVGTN